jgi:hypothetical protein
MTNPVDDLLQKEATQTREVLVQQKALLSEDEIKEIILRSKKVKEHLSSIRSADKLPFFSRKFLQKEKRYASPHIE